MGTFESSDPVSMMRRQRGMISVESKNWMTEVLSFCLRRHKKAQHNAQTELTLTRAPMTPSAWPVFSPADVFSSGFREW